MSSKSFFEKENPIGDYLLNEEIGSGGFAKVVQAIHIPTGEKVAVKIMDKEQIFSEPLNLSRIQREIAILKIVRHTNIIKLYELMETPDKIYIVMEYCNGGELFDYIVSKQHLSERQACRFFQEIINCLEYLHSLNIVHRDIKPENLLLYKIKNNINLKLIDFGISNCYTLDKLLSTPCGTASYAPPEMHKGEEYYGLLSDIWSAGVVLYAMIFGYLPFCEDDEETNINNIIEGNYEIPEEASPELADLLTHLLDINPLTRYDLDQIKQHPWFNMVKNYKFTPGIIEGYNKIPIDMKIVELCEQHGYDKNKVIENVEKCNYNRNSAVYYILLSKMVREGYHSISDLYSSEYLRYINNPKNLIHKKEKEKEKTKNKDDIGVNNENKIIRHLSHPTTDNKNKEENSYIKNKNNNNTNRKENSEELKKNMNQKENKKKDKNKASSQKKKPKPKKRNEGRSNQENYPEAQSINTTTNNKIIKTNKNEKDNLTFNNSIPKKNNNSFTNSKKVLSQKQKQKIKEAKKPSKISCPELPKKIPNQVLKTEIINKHLSKKIMPIYSFHLISKTKEILNSPNDNETIKLDFMNTSFNKKLSDDIKENILKLKNPKKNLSQKEKEKKINKALISLKLKKTNKKKNIKIKKIKIGLYNNNIFKESNPKGHTIIHNRNASLAAEKKHEKNRSIDKRSFIRNDYSMSPRMRRPESHERRNIINIYVQNKNNVNSNNVYNINLITKNNYSMDKSSDFKNKNIYNNIDNIKVKKIKISKQNINYLEQKIGLNNNDYLNTTNIAPPTSNRYKKNGFETPNKLRDMHLKAHNKILLDSNNNKNNKNKNRNKARSQRDYNEKEMNKTKYINNNINSNKNLYANSFNNVTKNKKKIRLTYKSIDDNNLNEISFIKKNDKKDIKNIKTKKNKYNHYKSRSLMDIDSPNNIYLYKEVNNHTITENKRNDKILSAKYSSVKNMNRRDNNSINERKKLMNISFMKNISNNSNKHIEPKKFKGPIDLKCLLYTKDINQSIQKISNVLKRNKMNVLYIAQHKLRSTKNGQSYDIEFYSLNDTNIKNNNENNLNININDGISSLYESEVNLKTISGYSNYKNNKINNIYYYTITSKVCNNKNLMKNISRIIYTKFCIGKNIKKNN